MSASIWHKRYHDDALNGYMGLTLEERGAYTTLLDLMYQRGEALIDNEHLLAGWMQVSLRKYRSIVSRLVELGKIVRLDDGRLTNSRFEKEREKSLETSRKQAELGAKGGRKSGEARKTAKENNEAAEGSASKNRSQLEARKIEPNGSYSEAKASGADAPPDYRDELWTEGVRSLRRQTGKPDRSCRPIIGKWLKETGDDCRTVLSRIRQAEADRIGDPIAWIERAVRPRPAIDPVIARGTMF